MKYKKKSIRKKYKPNNSEKITPKYSKIALIGFRGAGKTTIAKHLMRYWNLELISLDDYIQKENSSSIESIVNQNGWEYFRKLETNALKKISEINGHVLLDTGGGIVENSEHMSSDEKTNFLKTNFFTIYLYMNDDKLLSRIHTLKNNKQRPSLENSQNNITDILRRRKPLYQKSAHAIVDITDTSPDEAAKRIVELLKE
ncbi:MAG: shikimate kinase [Spirochaetia bacterium]|nr:shikimate kinase [Spirochaetia bacterium]